MTIQFTPWTQKVWDAIPRQVQEKLLGNVWCASCRAVTTIMNVEGRVKQGDLVLTGVCAKCGGPVARLIESE